MLLSIGAFSRLSGLSIKALRIYDRTRLLRPAEVDRSTGYRRYRVSQIADAHRILAMRQMGMPLADVRRAPGDRGALVALRRSLEAQLEALAAQLAAVDDALSSSDAATSAVVIKRALGHRVASHRRALPAQADADALHDELWRASAVRGTVWHDCGEVSGRVDAQVFSLASTSRATADRTVLPAGLTASCLHGPGKAAERAAYRRLQAWLDSSGHRRAGPYREIYYRVDDRDALTEIQLPIEPTRGDVA